jgi:hypothetical protein
MRNGKIFQYFKMGNTQRIWQSRRNDRKLEYEFLQHHEKKTNMSIFKTRTSLTIEKTTELSCHYSSVESIQRFAVTATIYNVLRSFACGHSDWHFLAASSNAEMQLLTVVNGKGHVETNS